MAKTRVLVAEDSLTVRMRLVEILRSDPDVELVGMAADGKQAIELCGKLRPDVITMDMMMPVMSGLSATEYIMAHCPTPILVVSSSINRGELFRTYEALSAGAVDVYDKPKGDEPDGDWERKFLSTLKMVAKIRVITHPRARLMSAPRPEPLLPPPPYQPPSRPASGRRIELVAIGASTGGPGAIVEILRALPAEFRLPILFVLHINEPFGSAFAEWLDGQTERRVAYGKAGEPVDALAGRVAMAPVGRHMIVRDRRIHLIDTPERWSCRPSVDVLFESLGPEYGSAAAACLLTGMGKDGAEGLSQLRRAGGLTIAQNEASSIVYGMPREAALLGAAAEILPLAEIGPRLLALQNEGARS
jgi:two-component system chemotaxis response regulator CheB